MSVCMCVTGAGDGGDPGSIATLRTGWGWKTEGPGLHPSRKPRVSPPPAGHRHSPFALWTHGGPAGSQLDCRLSRVKFKMERGCCVVRASSAPSPAAALASDPDPSATAHPSSILSLPKCLGAPRETPSWSVGPSALAFSPQASRKTKKKEGGALRAQRASSNVFSNFEQTQIQEFKEVRDPLPRSSFRGASGNHMRVTK